MPEWLDADVDLASELAAACGSVVGASQVLRDPELRAPYELDWTRRWHGSALLVVRPGDPAEVRAVLEILSRHETAVVPQGGNTGLVGGGIPEPGTVVLSLARLCKIEDFDAGHGQMTVGAGVTLAGARAVANSAGWDVGVDLAARDRATIGGMVATNAGGIHVLRHGPMRSQVLGLEAVLGNGDVIDRLGGLLKDNAGYDLGGLLVGSEGTLGTITRVRLRLVPRATERAVALLPLSDLASVSIVAGQLRRSVDFLAALEAFDAEAMALVTSYLGAAMPWRIDRVPPWTLLVECAGRRQMLDELAAGLSAALGGDGVRSLVPADEVAVAADERSCDRLWAYRDRLPEAIARHGVPHKLDLTLPFAELVGFESDLRALMRSAAPGARTVCFGHVGDGNLHVNLLGPDPMDDDVDAAVFELVARHRGSISAEHGIGRAKRAFLHLSRSPSEIAAMKRVKRALDPDGRCNPGVLFEAARPAARPGAVE